MRARTLIAPDFRTRSYTSQLQDLQEACTWADITKGRAIQYQELIREFFEKSLRSKEHILALNESCEVVDIWASWKDVVGDFPGLLARIRDALRKGPILREGENPTERGASNRPRNDAFVYLLAGKLISMGKHVVCVDGMGRHGFAYAGNADVVVQQNQLELIVECKRPNSETALEERTKEARSQIGGSPGIIAIDCSSVVRPPGMVIEKESGGEAEEFLSILLKDKVKPIVEPLLRPNLLGFVLFARAPAMTPISHSRLVGVSGRPLASQYRPDCIATLLLVENSNGSHLGILESIFEQ